MYLPNEILQVCFDIHEKVKTPSEGQEEILRLFGVEQNEQLVCPNCDGEGFSGKGTNEILPCLSCFGSGERVD